MGWGKGGFGEVLELNCGDNRKVLWMEWGREIW